MASEQEIQKKVDLYDCMVKVAMAQYELDRANALMEIQQKVVDGENELTASLMLIERSMLAKSMLTNAATERMPLLRQIRDEIDALDCDLSEEFVQVRQMAEKILTAEAKAKSGLN